MSNFFSKSPRQFLDRIPVDEYNRSWSNQDFGTGMKGPSVKNEGTSICGTPPNAIKHMHQPFIFRFEVPGAGKPQTGTQVVHSKAKAKV